MVSAVIGFVVCALWLHWSKFDFHLTAVLAFSTAGFQSAFLSNWYFQGRQTLRQITLVTVVSRLLSVLAVVLFIRTKAHFDLLVLFMTIPPFLFAFVPFWMMVKECSLNVKSVATAPVVDVLKTCIPFSVSGISAIVKDRIGVVLVATTLRSQDAAVLDLASKVVELVAGVFYNLTRALYPHFAARPDTALFKKFFYGTMVCAIAAAGMLSLGKPFIVRMLTGDPSVIAMCPLGILCWVLPFLAGSSLLGHIVLLCNRQDRHFMGNLVLSAAFYLALLLGLYLTEWRSVVMVSLSYVAAIAFEFSHRVYLVYKLNLKAWIR
jgi:O-antigen/teichoic acid export membrane protein